MAGIGVAYRYGWDIFINIFFLFDNHYYDTFPGNTIKKIATLTILQFCYFEMILVDYLENVKDLQTYLSPCTSQEKVYCLISFTLASLVYNRTGRAITGALTLLVIVFICPCVSGGLWE